MSVGVGGWVGAGAIVPCFRVCVACVCVCVRVGVGACVCV